MKREDEPGAYTLEEMDQIRWEQTFGKDFPIKAKHCDLVGPILLVAFVAFWVWRAISFVRNERRCDELLARAAERKRRREEAAEKRPQVERIERVRLKRERLRRNLKEDET